MDSSELNNIAMAYEESLLAQNLTKAELIMLLALVKARISIRIATAPTETPVRKPSISERPHKTVAKKTPVKTVKPPTKKSVAYDPQFDPPPPMTGDPVPPRNEPSKGKVIIPKNTAAICDACRKVVYITNKDVTEGMAYDDFAAAFTPTDPGIELIGESIDLQNIDGNISVDCPACNAPKALYLIGRRVNSESLE